MADALFDAEQIRTASFVRHVEIHGMLGSTNDRAAELARDAHIAMPALVVAQRQTSGRGRGQNVWWAANGALAFSVLLDTVAMGIGTGRWPQLSLATAVAVCDALGEEGRTIGQRAGSSSTPTGVEDDPARIDPQFRVAIKWPNDVLLNDRKVCGILIESPGGGAPAKDRLIIGIGVNVNNTWRDAPCDISSSCIGLGDVTNVHHVLSDTLLRILNALDQRLRQLAADDPRLPHDWQQLCSLQNRGVCVETGGRVLQGTCGGMADDGALLVRTISTTERVYSGSVHML